MAGASIKACALYRDGKLYVAFIYVYCPQINNYVPILG